jgi:hypothetical protein
VPSWWWLGLVLLIGLLTAAAAIYLGMAEDRSPPAKAAARAVAREEDDPTEPTAKDRREARRIMALPAERRPNLDDMAPGKMGYMSFAARVLRIVDARTSIIEVKVDLYLSAPSMSVEGTDVPVFLDEHATWGLADGSYVSGLDVVKVVGTRKYGQRTLFVIRAVPPAD